MSTGIDYESERYIIACMLQKEEVLQMAIEKLQVSDFVLKENQNLFIAISQMYDNQEKVDIVTVPIKHREIIKTLPNNWSTYTDVFYTEGGVKTAINKLKAESKNRVLLNLADKIKADIKSGENPDTVFSEIEKCMVERTSTANRKYLNGKEFGIGCLEAVCERMDEATRTKNVIYTGFKSLNKISGGMEKGDLIIISGRTGGGKSIFAMNLIKDIAIMQKRPSLYLNSEMSERQMQLRLLSHMSQYSHQKLRGGENITTDDFRRLSETSERISQGNFIFATIPDLQVETVIGDIVKYKRRNDIEFVIVDYVGRVDTMNNKNKDDWQLYKSAAQKLKTIAQELGLVVIMIAQLSKSGDLAQSSYMSHEADLWLSIEKMNEEDVFNNEPFNRWLDIKKARNVDDTSMLRFRFNGDTLTFTDDFYKARVFQDLEKQKEVGKAV
ncbi:DnaB-like helicase C-terminal domain-containing protein [Anaerosinus sp.]